MMRGTLITTRQPSDPHNEKPRPIREDQPGLRRLAMCLRSGQGQTPVRMAVAQRVPRSCTSPIHFLSSAMSAAACA